MVIYFADRRMHILGQASTRLPEGVMLRSDTKVEEIDCGVATFECCLTFTDSTRLEVESWTDAGNYILRKSGNETEFYTIIETEIDTKNREVTVYAEDAGLDLLGEVVGAYEADKAYPAAHYINQFSYDSGFEIGINEISDLSRKLKWEGEQTATARILSVATQFDNAEISFSFDVDHMRVTHKYINIYKKRGKDIGDELRLNRDVDRIITKKSVSNLATAFVVTGGTPEGEERPITLSGYIYDDGDFYVHDTMLKSRKALAKWSRYLSESGTDEGHILKTFTYDTLSKSELCNRAVSALKKICDMEVNYEVDVSILPENVRIGDTVNIVDDKGELYLSARVLKLVTSGSDGTSKATLGNYLLKESGISQKLEDLATQFKEIAKNRAIYTWVAYADDDIGTGISINPEGKKYMGTAANKLFKAPDLSDPAVYSWSLIRGSDGEPGVGIERYEVMYQESGSGIMTPTGEWSLEIPKVRDGWYLWTRTTLFLSNGKTSVSYSVGKIGEDGTDGEPGQPGSDGIGVSGTSVTYQISSSGTEEPTGMWRSVVPAVPNGFYLWTKTETTYSDGTTVVSFSVSRNGNNGLIVSATEPAEKETGMLWQRAPGEPIKMWDGTAWIIHYISAENLDVEILSAIAANLGTVTAGKIRNARGSVNFDIDTGTYESWSSDLIQGSVLKDGIFQMRGKGADTGLANLRVDFQNIVYNHENSGKNIVVGFNYGEDFYINGVGILSAIRGKSQTSHASSGTGYGVGTTGVYGHVKTVNALTQASHADGTALSAYQGKLLNDRINTVNNNLSKFMNKRNAFVGTKEYRFIWGKANGGSGYARTNEIQTPFTSGEFTAALNEIHVEGLGAIPLDYKWVSISPTGGMYLACNANGANGMSTLINNSCLAKITIALR